LALVRYRSLLHKDGRPALTLEGGRLHKGALVVRAPEIASKEAADAARGIELYAPRDAFKTLDDEDEFYLADLIGLLVLSPKGAALGQVKAVQNFGAGDILEIVPDQGPSFYLPFTRAVVAEVRIAEGVLVAEPPAEVEDPGIG